MWRDREQYGLVSLGWWLYTDCTPRRLMAEEGGSCARASRKSTHHPVSTWHGGGRREPRLRFPHSTHHPCAIWQWRRKEGAALALPAFHPSSRVLPGTRQEAKPRYENVVGSATYMSL